MPPGTRMDYLFAWRDAMSPFDQDPYETDLLAGENNARQVLGLERVTEITQTPTRKDCPSRPHCRKCQKFRKCPGVS